jgi:hypothetical protein
MTTGCRETIESIFSDDIEEGEEVMFTTSLPTVSTVTRADGTYTAPKENYQFTIGMYTDESTKVAEGTYKTIVDDEIGTLEAVTPLYWPGTTTAYGFKATAGNETLEADQTTKYKWLLQDRLEGDAGYYKNAKDWKLYNKESKLVSNDEDYKKILLPMQHKRSLITVILKAGEGVSRKALAYDVADKDLSATIFSYGSSNIEIAPLVSEEKISYDDDKNGAAESNVSTTRYDAIVEPHDYSAAPANDVIVKVSLSGQKYSFYAENDIPANLSSYSLDAGKHLTITVTLTRDSRKAMMSAYIEDWTEEVTTTICDDYGNAGEPIEIATREELMDFLGSATKNKAGNVALVTKSIDLEDWSQADYGLNCTLNLGGCTILSNHRFLNSIESAASLINGTIQIGSEVDAAIATTNNGVIEDVKITAKDGTTAHATTAGAVVNNLGTISKCRSSLSVYGGSAEFVGGIAATSTMADNKTSIIDACTVTGSVSGGTYGGGVVGKANGYVTNNTFEYGITLLQDKDKYKNIVAVKNDAHTYKFENNSWPTIDTDLDMTNVTPKSDRYTGIIANQAELQASVINANNNKDGNSFRLAQNIEVNTTIGDVSYNLDGDKKQITTSAMIFNSITGNVHDLTVYVSADLLAEPNYTYATDAIAPLAFAVHGDKAEISNVKVKMADGTRIQAANPAGLVVWAYGGAKVTNCEVKANIQTWLAKGVTPQGERFAGGIVSQAAKATISQCVFHSITDNKTLYQNLNTAYDNSGTANGVTQSTIVFYGGIVGGVNKYDSDDPELTITDCTCYVTLPKDAYHGGILGYAYYLTNLATFKDCQGNWWQSECYGVGNPNSGIESLIGKRNSITPTETTF